MVVVLALANAALLRHPKFNKSIGYYGFVAALVGLIFFALFVALENPPIIMEWAAAYAGFLWVWLFSWNALHDGHDGHNVHNGAVSGLP
jgi:protein-S-isoprenylcysteine O-methyltransferase Ste14